MAWYGAWRITVPALLVAVLLPLQVAAGTEEAPEMTDDAGDVERDGGSASSPFAEALDFRSIWFTEDGAGLYWVHVKVTELAGLTAEALGEDGYANYGIRYDARDGTSYQITASFGNGPEWTCQVGEPDATSASAWSRTPGYVDAAKGIIHMQVPSLPMEVDATAPMDVPELTAQAWGAGHSDEEQSVDWAFGAATRLLGDTIPVEAAPTEGVWCGAPEDVDLSQAEGAIIRDPAGDVTRAGESVDDALAQTMDLLDTTFTVDRNGDVWVHVDMADLTQVQRLTDDDPDLSLQYAVTFGRTSSERDFQLSFVTGGTTYSNEPGAWHCNVLDVSSGEWTPTHGFIDENEGIFHARWTPAAQDILASGERIMGLGASAWASHQRESVQTNDWATTQGHFLAADLPVVDTISGEGMTPCPGESGGGTTPWESARGIRQGVPASPGGHDRDKEAPASRESGSRDASGLAFLGVCAAFGLAAATRRRR